MKRVYIQIIDPLKRVDVETTFPGMPHHSRYCGAGTSKLINITRN